MAQVESISKVGDVSATLHSQEKKSVARLLKENPYMGGVALFASLGGFLFGYDQGVVSGVITMESFGATFPRVYSDDGFKGWFVSTLLLAAWFGSLINAPIADRLGRKLSMILAVIVFLVGSALQAAANTEPVLFAGRAVAGLAVGMLTMVVPMYMSEISLAEIRGTLVVTQQLSITLGILVSYWLEYGTHYIGGVRCAPNTPYTGGTSASPAFDPYNDVPTVGCTGQSDASWRIPLALQNAPALLLGVGMLFFPETPRWLLMAHQGERALHSLSRLRSLPQDHPAIREELLAFKAEVLFEQAHAEKTYPGKRGFTLAACQYYTLVSTWSNFKRLAIGSSIMFFQQFLGCNAIIYYSPTIFSQLGLDGNTTSLLATGVYGIVNTLSTIPALLLIDRIGRRKLLMSGAVGTMISLVIVGGIIGGYGSSLISNKTAGWAGVAFVYIYDVNFSYSWAPIGWVLPSEIFSLGNRAKAISITTSSTWMCNFIIGLVTPKMLSELANGGTYFFFAAFALISFFFVWFCVPETKGKSLEDMDAVFGDNAAHDQKLQLFQIAAELHEAERSVVRGEKV